MSCRGRPREKQARVIACGTDLGSARGMRRPTSLLACAAACVVLVPAVAGADDWALGVGVGVHHHTEAPEPPAASVGERSPRDERATEGLHVVVMRSIGPELAIGVRAGASSAREFRRSWWGTVMGTHEAFSERSVHAGATARVHRGRWWAAPWLGVRSAYVTGTTTGCIMVGGRPLTCSESAPLPSDWVRARIAVGTTAGADIVPIGAGWLGVALDAHLTSAERVVGVAMTLRR